MKKISVIGCSSIEKGSQTYEIAYQVGKYIAAGNAALICGGLSGVMEAACKGAKDNGGLTIGILPTTDEETANEWVDIKLPTGLGYARNALVILASHAVIAIDGAEGTLSEIGYAITYGKPLIGLNTWKIKPCREVSKTLIMDAATPEEAVELALKSMGD